ncbi:hypothetical protein V8G54_015582, partial [Vigna mungo]
MTTASISPCLQVEPEKTSLPGFLVTGKDSPVRADWSILRGSPSKRRASAGTISPNLMLIKSPGTKIAASSSLHFPSLNTFVLGARPAIKAAAALPALFSSMKLMVELMSSNTTIPRKSCQSGGLPPPLANAMAMTAAASMTHESGFHIKPKNLRNLLSVISSSLLGPN